MTYYQHKKLHLDWWTIIIYLLLVIYGWFSIYSSTYSGEDAPFYDFHYRYGMQLLWIAVSFVIAIVIYLLDSRYFFYYSFLFYGVGILLMLLAFFVGKEINGAHSWISLGSVSFQPVEFMKIGTALCFARIVDMGSHTGSALKMSMRYAAVLLIPVMLALLQNDAGSAMVFFIFFAVLYREGLPSWIYVIAFSVITVTVFSFLVDREVLICLVILAFFVYFASSRGEWKLTARYCAASLLALFLSQVLFEFLGIKSPFGISVTIVGLITLGMFFLYFHLHNKSIPWVVAAISLSLVSLCFAVDTAFDFLKPHQQERILDIFGISTDPKGISYNVNQSKIAIGSGGFTGRGFLQGTQTQYSYVPEQETDFIFSTVGEEQGFIGTLFLIVLFLLLILRLMQMGERAPNTFNRVYCYCVAGVFFFHFVINISMTIGLFPVIGIPLPFFSYGGSSFLCFTMLLFIAISMDRKRGLDNF